MLFLGLVWLPIWFGILSQAVFVSNLSDGLAIGWDVLLPVTLILCGTSGVVGLSLIIGAVSTDLPLKSRRGTLALIALGIIGWLGWVFLIEVFDPPIESRSLLFFFTLPAFGVVHFLYLARRQLFGPCNLRD